MRIMDKELENLLENYENVIYGKAFPINPSTHQLHLLLDWIANLEQQCKKQKEVIDKIQKIINTEIKLMGYAVNDSCLMLIQDILNEVTNNE